VGNGRGCAGGGWGGERILPEEGRYGDAVGLRGNGNASVAVDINVDDDKDDGFEDISVSSMGGLGRYADTRGGGEDGGGGINS
jgi:hypothetical protein